MRRIAGCFRITSRIRCSHTERWRVYSSLR